MRTTLTKDTPLPSETWPGFLEQAEQTLNMLALEVHLRNVRAGWWTDINTREDLHGKRNVGELLALVHSEVSEAAEAVECPILHAKLTRVHESVSRALEGHRKSLMDDKLPHRPQFRVELIDAMIRELDILGSQDNEEHPAGKIFLEKMGFNAVRPDHKIENRIKDGGKKI